MSSTYVEIRRTSFARGLRFSVFDPARDAIVRTFPTYGEAYLYVARSGLTLIERKAA